MLREKYDYVGILFVTKNEIYFLMLKKHKNEF